jgi:hypothetical protein
MAQLMVQIRGSQRLEMISAPRLSPALPPGQFLRVCRWAGQPGRAALA